MRPVGHRPAARLRSATTRSRSNRDLPPFRVISARLHGDEPAMADQGFGRFDRTLPIPDGARPVLANIPRTNGGLGPVVLQPVEQPPRRQGSRLGSWLLLRPPRTQSFKYVLGHCRHLFALSRVLRLHLWCRRRVGCRRWDQSRLICRSEGRRHPLLSLSQT